MFELHVTLAKDSASPYTIELNRVRWTSSRIADDPILGAGTRFYRTAYCSTRQEAYKAIQDAQGFWTEALRFKIEQIVYDFRKQG